MRNISGWRIYKFSLEHTGEFRKGFQLLKVKKKNSNK